MNFELNHAAIPHPDNDIIYLYRIIDYRIISTLQFSNTDEINLMDKLSKILRMEHCFNSLCIYCT